MPRLPIGPPGGRRLPQGAGLGGHFQQAVALYQAGRLDEARKLCQQITQQDSGHVDALHLLGAIWLQAGQPARAVECFRKAIRLNGSVAAFHNNLGVGLKTLEHFADAVASFDRALALHPDDLSALVNRGATLHEMGRLDEALAALDKAIGLSPESAAAHANRCNVLRDLGRLDEALVSVDRAIGLNGRNADVRNSRGVILARMGRLDDAVEAYEGAIALAPKHAKAHNNLGNALAQLRRLDDALARYDEAIAANPDYANALVNRAETCIALGRMLDAVESCDRALKIGARNADAHYLRAQALRQLKRFGEALKDCDRALALRPDFEFLPGFRLQIKTQLCDWSGLDREIAALCEGIARGGQLSAPFPVLALTQSETVQRRAAEIWVASRPASGLALPAIARHARGEKMRVGYFSADLYEHATADLMAGLFEQHDRNRFEIFAYHFGPDGDGPMRARLAGAIEHFIDVRALADRDVALLAREHGIDLAVDLKGFTTGARFNIFSHRAAPIQASYLGYPGTLGAACMDYVIADAHVLPEASRAQYAEKIVTLPHSYQANDRARPIAEYTPSRAELGLPDGGFVFCCFNNSYKIMPEIFDLWMRILGAVPGSVLWLLADSTTMERNLRREAAARGIAPERLIFAERVASADHLARQRAADLFLDTLPYGAHTTASEALWVGLPVLTRTGQSFAGRVASSLLHAIELPELITTTPAEYEALAVELARDPARLAAVRERLARNRLSTPLFDTALFTREIEAAFEAMVARYLDGLAPADSAVGVVG